MFRIGYGPSVTFFHPLPRTVTRPLTVLILILWVGTIGTLARRSTPVSLATDLSRYGTTAQWRGVYYRGDKIGFTVSQTVPTADGFELQEDGRLEMTLLGATTATSIRTTVKVDRTFALRSFEFSLDPGTGPIDVRGALDGRRLTLSITSAGVTRSDVRELAEPPVLSLNLARKLAAEGLTPGARHNLTLFDPATLRNAPVIVSVHKREVVRIGATPVPAFRVETEFSGLRTTAWITDTGEIVKEESPIGMITIKEPPETARASAVPWRVRADLLEAAAVVPLYPRRIDDPRSVRRLRVRLDGANLSDPELQGAGQKVEGNVVELVDPRTIAPTAHDTSAARYLAAEPLIESDAPEIKVAAELAVRGVAGARARAERLTRHVNGLLDKKPTVSLPSAREVLRTKVGDCNEHTALFVAMARAVGIPARIAVGLVDIRGAFYYHAWPEVYLDEGGGRGLWLPVDPTLNQFPADATHLRLARGGLDKQAAILPLIGRLRMTVLDLDLAPTATPILVGREETDLEPVAIDLPKRDAGGCWSRAGRR